MKRTGSFQSAARLSDSWNSPCGTAPSPKKQRTTWSPPWYLMAKPAPAASGRGGAADDAVAAQEVDALVEEMHGAALAVAEPVAPAEELGHDAPRVRALGQA